MEFGADPAFILGVLSYRTQILAKTYHFWAQKKNFQMVTHPSLFRHEKIPL